MNSPIPLHHHFGTSNPNCKTSEAEVHLICSLLRDTTLSIAQIARKVKSTPFIVRSLYKKRTWRFITSTYNFYPRKPNGS